MTAAILEMEGMHAGYGQARVLFDVSLRIDRGECVCLLGRNGVGKTTTMRSIMGLTRRSHGRVHWNGREIMGLAPYRIAKLGVGFVPEARRVFGDLTVGENLDVAI